MIATCGHYVGLTRDYGHEFVIYGWNISGGVNYLLVLETANSVSYMAKMPSYSEFVYSSSNWAFIWEKWYQSEDVIRMIKEIADPSPSGYGGGEGEQQGTEIQKARLMAPWIAGGICVLAAAVLVFAKKKKGLE